MIGWHYAVGQSAARSYYVIEYFRAEGDRDSPLWTGAITPFGESKEDLLAELKRMVKDIERVDCPVVKEDE